MKMTQETGLATIEQACTFLSLSRATVYRLIYSGRLQSVKIGGARRIPWKVLEQVSTPRELQQA